MWRNLKYPSYKFYKFNYKLVDILRDDDVKNITQIYHEGKLRYKWNDRGTLKSKFKEVDNKGSVNLLKPLLTLRNYKIRIDTKISTQLS